MPDALSTAARDLSSRLAGLSLSSTLLLAMPGLRNALPQLRVMLDALADLEARVRRLELEARERAA